MTEQTTSKAQIKSIYSAIQLKLHNGVGTPETQTEARERLEALQDDLSYLIGDRGFEEFVESKLEEYRRETDKALCSCWRVTCPLKRGEVPPKLRQHSGGTVVDRRPPSELLVEYTTHHDGAEALNLIRQEWGRMAVRVELELSSINSLLARNPQSVEAASRRLGVSFEDDTSNGDDTGDTDSDTSGPGVGTETADQATAGAD